MANKRININVGFNTDKASLEEIQSLFQRIAIKAADPANKLNTSLQQAGKTAQTLDGILEKTFNTNLGTLNVTKFNQELQKSGLTIKQIKTDLVAAGNQGTLAYNRLAQAILGTNLQLKQSNKLLDNMFTTFKNTVRYGISSSIFNNFTNSITKAYEYTKKLNTSLNNIRIVTGKSADEMDKFAEKANAAAKKLSASTLDITNASLIYYQQGLSDIETQARAETTVKVANVTRQSADEVSEQLTAVWNGYKVSAQETEAYIDKLAAVAKTTAADLEELSTGMSKVASAAASMGVNFDDLNAQIATIVSVTRQAPESVGTALKTIYARIGDLKVDGVDEFGVKLGEVSSQLEVMGVQVIKDNGDMKDMSTIMTEVASKWDTWTQAQKQAAAVAIAGKRQYNNLIALFDNWDMYTKALETSTNALGTLQEEQDIYMESTQAKLTKLRATWQDLYKRVGDTDTINTFIDGIRNLVQVLDNFSDSFGGGLKSIAAFGVVIANIFNKQIAESIKEASLRSDRLKQNMAVAKTAMEVRQAGVMKTTNEGGIPTIEDQAAVKNSEVQYQISQKIYEVSKGLTQEEINQATEYQKQIGLLTEKEFKLNANFEEILKETQALSQLELTDIQINDILNGSEWEYERITGEIYSILEAKKKEYNLSVKTENLLQETLTLEEDISKVEDKIITTVMKEDKQRGLLLKNLLKEETSEEGKRKIIERQLTLSKTKNVNLLKEQKQIDEINEKLLSQENTVKEIEELKRQQQGYQIELDSLTVIGERASQITQKVTGITTALGSAAMAWSSVNSMFQTWSDETASFGDKITQTIMTATFTIPMLLKNIKDLGISFGITTNLAEMFGAISQKNIAIQALRAQGIKITSKEIRGLNEAEIKELITAKAGTYVHLEESGAITNESGAKAIDKGITDSLTVSQNALNASVLAFPGVWILAALTGLIAVTAGVIAYNKKQVEAQKEINQQTVETVSKTLEEVDANKQLYDSLEQVYGKYKEGIAAKEEMATVAEELAKKYNLEGLALAKLTGNYDDLMEAAKKARKAELEQGIKESEKGMAAQADLASLTGAGANMYYYMDNYDNYVHDEQGRRVISAGASKKDEQKAMSVLKSLGAQFGQEGELLLPKVDMDDMESVKEYYDTVHSYYEELSTLSAKDKKGSEFYQGLQKIEEELGPVVEKYKELEESNKSYKEQLAFNNVDFEQITSLEEYQQKVEEVKKSFIDLGKTEEEANEIVSSYVKDSTNEIIKQAKAIEDLGKKYYQVTRLSLEDQQFLIEGKLDITEIEGLSAEEIHKRVEIAKKQLSPEDLTVPISLMAKVSSSKLSKTDLKEFQEQEGELAGRYDVEFANFDSKSMLDQSDTLNRIIQEEVANRTELLKTYDQAEAEKAKLYSKKAEVEQDRLNKIEEEKANIEQKLASMTAGELNTTAGHQQYIELQKQLRLLEEDEERAAKKILEFQELAKGLDFEEFEAINFETWTTGIDATINSVKTLNNSIANIGENWAIATDKIEQFAMNYPTILADQENFNYLQDGSIALTEKGQQALQDEINLRKEDIKAQGKAYMLELQKQADLQYAQAQYYQDQIDALETYLNNEADATDTEKKLRESVYNFSAKVAELTGKSQEEVMKQIVEDSKVATDAQEQNTQAIFDYWVDCGNAVSAYGQALLSENFTYTPPTPNALNGRNTGSNLSAASLNKVDAAYKKNLDKQLNDLNRDSQQGREEIQKQIETLTKLRDAAIAKGDAEMAKRASYDAQIHKLENDLADLGKGKNSKSKKNEKNFDDEFNRYYDIKKAVDLVNDALDKLSKIQEKLHGKELIQALKNENELIKQQSANYEELYRQQQIEAKELQNSLMGYDAEFDEEGFLTNYATLTTSALEQYKQKIAEYNAGKITEEVKNAYEESYNQMKKELERYDTLFYSEMKDTKDQLDEYYRKTMENNLKMWETEIQVSLDMSQAKRDWADFMKDINEDFKKVYKDLNIEMSHLMTKMETYSGIGTIETDLQAIKDVMNEIDKISSGQTSNMFESISDAQEKLKELDKQLEDDAKNMKQLWQDAWDTYLEGIDQADSKLEDMMDRFEKVNEELEFQEKLVQLLYGNEAYGLMEKLYDGQEKAMMNQIGAIKTQTDMWHQLWVESGATMDNQSEWSEDQQKYYEQWMECQSALNDMTTEYIELLQKDYLNAVNKILNELEKNINGGMLEDIKTQWERIIADSDKYYDGIEKAYEVQKFANKIDQDIVKTTGKNQQKLQSLREKEISYLRQKENLTKYDLEAAEARYQIALKEIALEEAQQNKTSMKLVRNEEGNWSYQYMADADDVAKKQDDLLQSYGDLYKLAGDAYQNNLEALQSLEERYLQSAATIAEKYREQPEELARRMAELDEWYQDHKNKLVEENELYRQDLQTSGAGLLLQVYQQDEEAYAYMISSEQIMLDNLIQSSVTSYQDLEGKVAENYNHMGEQSAKLMAEVRQDWTSSAQTIADRWNSEDEYSVKTQIQTAYAAIGQATADYQAQVDQLAIEVGRDFGQEGISGAIDKTNQSTNDLKQAVQNMCMESTNYLQGLKDIVNQVGQEFESIVGTVQSAILKVQEYLAIVGKAKSVSAQSYDVTGGIASLGSYDGISDKNRADDGGDASLERWYVVGNDHYGAKGKNILHSNNTNGFSTKDEARKAIGDSIERGVLNGVISDVGFVRKKDFDKWKAGTVEADKFDTGGYTGAWDNTGKLAILHQKELVLNANDTANFLSGISMLRNMISLNGSIEQSIAAAVGNMALQLSGIKAGSVSGVAVASASNSGDTYYVTAEFPNANDAEEIKQAIMNLPNIVSQYIHQNGL